jgi:hypothetical protein
MIPQWSGLLERLQKGCLIVLIVPTSIDLLATKYRRPFLPVSAFSACFCLFLPFLPGG